MVRSLYGLDYETAGIGVSPLLFNVMMYQIGDKYVVPHLKLQGRDKFEALLARDWD